MTEPMITEYVMSVAMLATLITFGTVGTVTLVLDALRWLRSRKRRPMAVSRGPLPDPRSSIEQFRRIHTP